MRFREGLKTGYFAMQIARDEYRDLCIKGNTAQNRTLLRRFAEVQTLLLTPICPHYAEHTWREVLGNKGSAVNQSWPTAGTIDRVMLHADDCLRSTVRRMRRMLDKAGVVSQQTTHCGSDSGAHTC